MKTNPKAKTKPSNILNNSPTFRSKGFSQPPLFKDIVTGESGLWP
jgi:hypothetical protein